MVRDSPENDAQLPKAYTSIDKPDFTVCVCLAPFLTPQGVGRGQP